MGAVVDTSTLGIEEYPYAVYRRVFDTDRMAMSLVSVRPGAAVPMHAHHDEEQVYYVLAGRGTVTVGDRHQRVGPGHAVHIPLDTQHGVSNDSAADPLDYLYVVTFVKPAGG
jgi:quercetin dioxygenase-like cupin family protein